MLNPRRVRAWLNTRSEGTPPLRPPGAAAIPVSLARPAEVYIERVFDVMYQDARLWADLAAAYGQAYWHEQSRDAATAALQKFESKALDAIKNALEANPTPKSLLRMLWDPNAQTKAGSQENDLEVFHSHTAFRALLE
jgi:hypothetical protein